MNANFKNALYGQLARIGKALSSPKRLELLDLINHGERNVELLAKESGMSIANTSQHLQVLRSAKLVEAEKDGLYVTYRIASESVSEFSLLFHKLAQEQLADIDQLINNFKAGKDNMEPISRRALLERVAEGTSTVIDVRPVEEYRAGHIPGAVSIPLKELEGRLAEIPPDKEVVAYCRGHYCILAMEAVERLRNKGYQALHLKDGMVEWRAEGLPVESGNKKEAD